MIDYTVVVQHAHRHLFEVTLCFSNEKNESTSIFFPNWTAGSYRIRDFCKNVIALHAHCDNLPQVLRQINKNTWVIPSVRGTWTIKYQLYAFDTSVRGAFLDETRAFFDGAALLMAVAGRQNEACALRLSLPEEWDVAIALSQASDGRYHADHYAALIDAPLAAGSLRRMTFMVENILHEIVLDGTYEHLDATRLCADAQKICAAQLAVFGKAPFTRYTFLLHVADEAYGGLEHRASSALLAARRCLPSMRSDANRADYITLLGLFSHEYFHAWNVKSIAPRVFQNNDLQAETYTEQLWAFEGITSYYDDLTLLRAGVVTPTEYAKLLVKTIDAVWQGSGRLVQSLAQSSFNAWTKYYQQDENSANAIVSYYQKGALVALCLDVQLRRATNGRQSLDDVMWLLYARFCVDGQGLDDGDWQRAAEEIAGKDLSDFFQSAIYGTDDLPLSEYLAAVGMELRFVANDQCGVVKDFPEALPQLNFGAKLEEAAGGRRVLRIDHGAQAERAGLAVGDVIVALNRCGASEFNTVWGQVRAGDGVTLHYLRQNRLHERCFTVTSTYPQRALLKIVDEDHMCCALSVPCGVVEGR